VVIQGGNLSGILAEGQAQRAISAPQGTPKSLLMAPPCHPQSNLQPRSPVPCSRRAPGRFLGLCRRRLPVPVPVAVKVAAEMAAGMAEW